MINNTEDCLNFAILIDSSYFKDWEVRTIERLCASKSKSVISVIECCPHKNIIINKDKHTATKRKLSFIDRTAINLYRAIDKTNKNHLEIVNKDEVCQKYNILYDIKGTLKDDELLIERKINNTLKKINVIIDFRLLLRDIVLTPFQLTHGIWFHNIGNNNDSLSLLMDVLSKVGEIGLSIRSYSTHTRDVSSIFCTSIRPHSVSLIRTKQYIYNRLPSLYGFAVDKYFCNLYPMPCKVDCQR